MFNLSVVIPDYKSSCVEKTIDSVLLINPDEFIISNFKTNFTESVETKYKDNEKVKFLNFLERKNPGDYRNCGAERASKKNLLFIDSDMEINSKTIEFLKELWAFLRVRKKLWLAPIIIMMLILGGLLTLVQGSVVAPFIYTLF